MADPSPPVDAAQPWVEVFSSRGFPAWLADHQVSLALTTYQTGKLFLIGLGAQGQLSVFERTFNRCMGLWAEGQSLWLATRYQVWRFENSLPPGGDHQGYDRLYVPRVGDTTGDHDVHYLAVDDRGRLLIVNTLFNCLATLHPTASFEPLWQPPFISRLAAEDRCHLNGLALLDRRPACVTAVSQSDVVDAWRDRRRDGGCVLEVPSGRPLAAGLSMPHSPRYYRGRLWLLDSGTGRLGSLPPHGGPFEPLAFCPGYARGLAFQSDFAVVGLSRPRRDQTFGGLPLDDELAARGAQPRCGVHVVDLRTGDTAHWLRIEGLVTELYDVALLPGAVRPMVLGFKSDEISQLLTVAPPGQL